MKVSVSTAGDQLSVVIEHQGHRITLNEVEYVMLSRGVEGPWSDLRDKRQAISKAAHQKAVDEAMLRTSAVEEIDGHVCRVFFGFVEPFDHGRPETWHPDRSKVRRIFVGTDTTDENKAIAVAERMGFGGSTTPRPFGFKIPRPDDRQFGGRRYYDEAPQRYVTALNAASAAIRWLKKREAA